MSPVIVENLNVEIIGAESRHPLVMFHGVTRAWQDFLPITATLERRWNIHAVDHRGHGRSERASDYRVANYVDDAVALIGRKIRRPAILYGHSLGAMVAAGVAAALGDRIAGLVLEDPPFDTLGGRIFETPFHSLFVGMRQIVAQGGTTSEVAASLAEVRVTDPNDGKTVRLGDVRDPTALRFGAKWLRRIDPRVLDPIIDGKWMEGYDRDGILSAIRCPTLLLQADWAAGGMLPDADAKRAAARIGECLHVRLDGVGHQIHWTQPETTLRLVAAFLESLEIDDA